MLVDGLLFIFNLILGSALCCTHLAFSKKEIELVITVLSFFLLFPPLFSFFFSSTQDLIGKGQKKPVLCFNFFTVSVFHRSKKIKIKSKCFGLLLLYYHLLHYISILPYNCLLQISTNNTKKFE